MIFLLKLALKNIGRNPRRTFLTSLGILVAVASVIFGKAFMDGSNEPMIQTIADMQTGHIRIVRDGYVQKERILPINLFFEYKSISEASSDFRNIDTAKPRIRFGSVLAFNDEETEGMLITGILPDKERGNVVLHGALPNEGGIVLSKSIAERMGIHIGDSVVLLSQTVHGYLNGVALRVDSFYETGINYIANSYAYIHIADAQKLLSIPKNNCTELLVYAKNSYAAFPLFLKIKNSIKERKDLDIIFWESSGSLIQALKIRMYIIYLVGLIIFFLASIAIVNTMVVALLERTKEIGMMKALGLGNMKIFFVFFMETLIIGFIGALLGCVVGYFITLYFVTNGIDYSRSLNNIKFPLNPIIYPKMDFGTIVTSVILGIVSSLISSFFLLKRIALLNPTDILRE